MKIGSLTIDKAHPLFLAPMAGVTDVTFRGLCRQQGADVTCTEMVSAKALYYRNRNTHMLLERAGDEHPVAVQLFGNEPELMAQMALKLEPDFDIIDVNMGCPVGKVVNNGEGSALMKNPALAAEIIRAMSRAVKKPVTVKIRAGFDEEHINAVDLALALEEAGAAAIAVHGRTREQMYHGKADRSIIARVKEALHIPVIGNGDIFSGEAARCMIEETGVDGLMIARGAQGNPWIFAEIRAALEGRNFQGPSAEDRLTAVLTHGKGLACALGEYAGIREMRKHLAWYTAGMPGSAAFRVKACSISTYEELENVSREFFGQAVSAEG